MRLTIFILFFVVGGIYAQTIKNYYPEKVELVDLSLKKQKAIERRDDLQLKEKRNASEEKELQHLLEKYDEYERFWSILPIGCSWYCGGGNYDIKSSSYLGRRYHTDYANDFSYQTAWVEGKPDEGIGEYLEYYFKNESPRITHIIISNGYMKTAETWQNNNRVKKLKLYVNHRPFGILNLKDSRSDQYFNIGVLGRNKDGSDLILRFEIMEVYRGNKYNDTAITQIYFDGIDVH